MLRGEERRFAGLLTRGRKVLGQFGPGRPLTEADLRYLHQTHGLPPELVTELLNQPDPATGCLASRSGTLNRRAARVRLADAEE